MHKILVNQDKPIYFLKQKETNLIRAKNPFDISITFYQTLSDLNDPIKICVKEKYMNINNINKTIAFDIPTEQIKNSIIIHGMCLESIVFSFYYLLNKIF